MLSAEGLRGLARVLSRTADRVGAVTAERARHAAGLTWASPRGRRAVDRAGQLAGSAGAVADELRAAAAELRLAADDLDRAP
jgi:hypothetical protein